MRTGQGNVHTDRLLEKYLFKLAFMYYFLKFQKIGQIFYIDRSFNIVKNPCDRMIAILSLNNEIALFHPATLMKRKYIATLQEVY